jgi:hypothetical protein
MFATAAVPLLAAAGAPVATVSDHVWRVLMRIPTHPPLLKAITSLEGTHKLLRVTNSHAL